MTDRKPGSRYVRTYQRVCVRVSKPWSWVSVDESLTCNRPELAGTMLQYLNLVDWIL